MKQPVFRFRDRVLPLGERTYIMGIINVTPDSFSDGGDRFSAADALAAAKEMEQAGADFLDIGGQSTRPGHIPISAEEEWQRLEPVLPALIGQTTLPISVDTFYPTVAERALALGCHIINDVSGVVAPQMAAVIHEYQAGWVLMHADEESESEICGLVHDRLSAMRQAAIALGVPSEQLCLDPGIGFGKTPEQNLALIAGTADVKLSGNAYLLGASRKRVIAAMVGDIPPNQRDAGTHAAHSIGILGGADILRVHDVAGAVQAACVTDQLKGRIKHE